MPMHPLSLTNYISRGSALWRERMVRIHSLRYILPILLLIAAFGLLRSDLGGNWWLVLWNFAHGQRDLAPNIMPSLLVGGGMFIISIGLLFKSRVAWYAALLLTVTAISSISFGYSKHNTPLLIYFVFVALAFVGTMSYFNRSSIAAGTLLGLAAVVLLLQYATFGSYYLGHQLVPRVDDLFTAFFYAVMTLSTLGYGSPGQYGPDAQLFTITVALLGVAAFATSVAAVIAPMIDRSVRHVMNPSQKRPYRHDHFVVIGESALATGTCRELQQRGQPFVRVLPAAPPDRHDAAADVVVGDAGNAEVLRSADADVAAAVLIMSGDDSENAFSVLAVKELHGHARIIVVVNEASHLAHVRLAGPDVIIAPQILGGELAVMVACGEPVPPDFLLRHVFQQTPEGQQPTPRDPSASGH